MSTPRLKSPRFRIAERWIDDCREIGNGVGEPRTCVAVRRFRLRCPRPARGFRGDAASGLPATQGRARDFPTRGPRIHRAPPSGHGGGRNACEGRGSASTDRVGQRRRLASRPRARRRRSTDERGRAGCARRRGGRSRCVVRSAGRSDHFRRPCRSRCPLGLGCSPIHTTSGSVRAARSVRGHDLCARRRLLQCDVRDLRFAGRSVHSAKLRNGLVPDQCVLRREHVRRWGGLLQPELWNLRSPRRCVQSGRVRRRAHVPIQSSLRTDEHVQRRFSVLRPKLWALRAGCRLRASALLKSLPRRYCGATRARARKFCAPSLVAAVIRFRRSRRCHRRFQHRRLPRSRLPHCRRCRPVRRSHRPRPRG